jgi:hypothetical protein
MKVQSLRVASKIRVARKKKTMKSLQSNMSATLDLLPPHSQVQLRFLTRSTSTRFGKIPIRTEHPSSTPPFQHLMFHNHLV